MLTNKNVFISTNKEECLNILGGNGSLSYHHHTDGHSTKNDRLTITVDLGAGAYQPKVEPTDDGFILAIDGEHEIRRFLILMSQLTKELSTPKRWKRDEEDEELGAFEQHMKRQVLLAEGRAAILAAGKKQ